MSETYQPDPNHPSFCQVCGRSVASEADRLAGNAFHCGLCNEVRLASPASTGYTAPDPAAAPGAAPSSADGMPGSVPPYVPVPPPYQGAGSATARPNPVLAAVLGLIPGVGAMYNGQYAKGVVHLIVFAILVNIADSHDVFGIFVAGWIIYQAIEAYHTARARRDGTLLPNPFGLNDIGDRFGFGKAWPAYPAPPVGTTTPPPPVGAPFTAQPPVPPPYQAAQAQNWGAPWEGYRSNVAPPPVPPVPPIPPFGAAYPNPPYGAPVPPYTAPFNAGYAPVDTMGGFDQPLPIARNRFPAGAIWLIALGTLFLLNTSGVFRGFPFRIFLPLFFLGLGVWNFVRKMTDTGLGLADDGSPAYRIRLFRAARSAVWLILLGVIFFLADFNILPWSRSWPLFLILAGVMTFIERAVYSGAGATGFGYPPPEPPPYAPYPPAAPPAAPSATVTETGLTNTADTNISNQEGR